jgi:hypothetical protein
LRLTTLVRSAPDSLVTMYSWLAWRFLVTTNHKVP